MLEAWGSISFFNPSQGTECLEKFAELEAQLSCSLDSAPSQVLTENLSAIRNAARQLRTELREEVQTLREQLEEPAVDASPAPVAELSPDLALARARVTELAQVIRCLFESIGTDMEIVHQRIGELPEVVAALLSLWRWIEERPGWTEAFMRSAESEWCDRVIAELEWQIAERNAELKEIERARCRDEKEWVIGVCGHSFCEKCAMESLAAGRCPYCFTPFEEDDLIAIQWE
jgi:hypothetical protein